MGEIISHIIFAIKHRFRKIMNSSGQYLNNGNYKMDTSFSYIYKEEDKKEIDELMSSTYSVKRMKNKKNMNRINNSIIRTFKLSMKLENSQEKFSGNLIMITSSTKERKIFDLKSKKVLTIFSTTEDVRKRKNAIEEFKKYFNIPCILEANIEENYIIEEYIEENPNIEIEEVFQEVLEQYINYYEKIKESNEIKRLSLEKLNEYNVDSYSKLIKQRIQELNQEEIIPIIKMHGDLWSSNLIKNKEKIYIIDWENIGSYYILYDFFTFIFNEAIINDEYILLEKYFNKEYDKYLKQYFSIFNAEFKEKYRVEYFLEYVYLFYYKLCAGTSLKFRSKKQKIINEILERYNITLN